MNCPHCQQGLPASTLGFHKVNSSLVACTNARYPMRLEPKERDTWHQPAKRVKANVPFVFGGGR